MNSNVPHAVRVIRTVMTSGDPDPAAAIARALDGERLLTDPERSYGMLLHRTVRGGWARGAPPMTEVERQAIIWDRSCARARTVAEAVERHIGRHPDVHDVRAEGDRVLVVLHVADRAQGARWRAYFGLVDDGREGARVFRGEGLRDGVRVSVVAYERPRQGPQQAASTGARLRLATAPSPSASSAPSTSSAPSASSAPPAASTPATSSPPSAASTPSPPVAVPSGSSVEGSSGPAVRAVADPSFSLDGQVYDLRVAHRDAQGDTWHFQGLRAHDGMPLLSLAGRTELCSLSNVTALLGPLTPVRGLVDPAAPAEEGTAG